MDNKIKIKEIFESIQGEGPYIGEKHLFVRTTKCNLKCKYCDTDFEFDENSRAFNYDEFFEIIKKSDAQTLSLTGGEPLIEADFLLEFFKKYKNRLNKKIYLETNGTMPSELLKIIEFVDIVSMDIKLKSTTSQEHNFGVFENFLKVASKKEVFAKIVFDKNILDSEIISCTELAKKYGVLLVLQPKMPQDEGFSNEEVFDKFYSKYKNIRLIPQMHKFLNIR